MEIVKETKTTRNSVDEGISESSDKGAEEELSLERRIQEMEKALADLKAMSRPPNDNDTKVDSATQFSLSNLPIELKSKIFMCLRPLPMRDRDCHLDNPFDPEKAIEVAKNMKELLLLGAVCRAWRSLAWALPELWATISVNVYNENDNVPEMIYQWLRRSGELPLHIYLYAAQKVFSGGRLSHHPYGNEPYISRLMYQINSVSERWFYLNLALPKRFMQQVHCSDMDAPILQTLTLQLNMRGIIDPAIRHFRPLRIVGDSTPNLRKVNLNTITVLGVELDWTSVTQVYTELSPAPIEVLCRLFLNLAPDLTHLTLGHLIIPYQGEILRHQNLSTLQINLSSIEIDGPYSEDAPDSLLAMLDLPALEDLGIFANRQSDLDAVASLLQRSACTLKTFRLNITDSWMKHKQDLIVLLKRMPDLEHLEVECRYQQAESDASPLPSQLPTPTVIEEMKLAGERIFLPNLVKVTLHLQKDDWSCAMKLGMQPDDDDDDDTEPPDPLYLTPLNLYYLLDPVTQNRIQLVIESGFWILPFWNIFHPIMGFIRRSLQVYRYTGDLPTSIG